MFYQEHSEDFEASDDPDGQMCVDIIRAGIAKRKMCDETHLELRQLGVLPEDGRPTMSVRRYTALLRLAQVLPTGDIIHLPR